MGRGRRKQSTPRNSQERNFHENNKQRRIKLDRQWTTVHHDTMDQTHTHASQQFFGVYNRDDQINHLREGRVSENGLSEEESRYTPDTCFVYSHINSEGKITKLN